MATSDNTINILLKAQDQASAILRKAAKQIESDVDSSTDSLERNGRKADSTGKSWWGLAGVAGAVGGIVSTTLNRAVDGLSSLLDSAAGRVDTLNNASRTFDNLGFSARDTNEMMSSLKQSILGLPTPLNEAVAGVENLSGATNDVKLAGQVYEAVNNAVLGFGGSAAQSSGAVQQLSQAISGGTIDAGTFDSLVQNGMGPALAGLARQMGVTTEQLKSGLSSGSISASDFERALIQLNTKGGGGMQSLKKIAHDSTDGIQSSWTNAKTAITRGLADIIQSFGSKNIASALQQFGAAVEDILKQVAALMPYLVDFAKWCRDNEPVILGVAGAVVAIRVALAIGSAITAFQVAFAGGMAAATASTAGPAAAIAGLRALVASPIGMGGIVVAGALADIGLVYAAVQSVIGAIQAMNDAAAQQQATDQTRIALHDSLKEVLDNQGKYSADRVAHAKTIWQQQFPGQKYALGTNFAPGGLAMVGERGPELVSLPTGSKVYPARETQQAMSQRATGLQIGELHIHNDIDEQRFLAKIGMRLALR